MEETLDFSALTKWKSPGRQLVLVHDILSDHLPDIREEDSLEVMAMIHTGGEEGDLLHSASELCVEDEAGPGDVLTKLTSDREEQKGYSLLATHAEEASGAAESPTQPEMKKEDPCGEEGGAGQEERSPAEPSGEERRGGGSEKDKITAQGRQQCNLRPRM